MKRSFSKLATLCLGFGSLLLPVASFAQSNPAATASSAANSAGTTVNNQNNLKLIQAPSTDLVQVLIVPRHLLRSQVLAGPALALAQETQLVLM